MPSIDGNGHGGGETQTHFYPKGVGVDSCVGNIFGNGSPPYKYGTGAGEGAGFYNGDGGHTEYSVYVRSGKF